MVKHYEGDSCPNCGRELDPLEACDYSDKKDFYCPICGNNNVECKCTLQYKNCKSCNDTDCIRQGDVNFVCAGWCNSLANKQNNFCFAKKVPTLERSCKTCSYKTMGLDAAHTCDTCIVPHKNKKDNWQPKLPDKHDNLTWWEADKLWHEGWDVRCWIDGKLENDWDNRKWSRIELLAKNYYVVGKRNKE